MSWSFEILKELQSCDIFPNDLLPIIVSFAMSTAERVIQRLGKEQCSKLCKQTQMGSFVILRICFFSLDWQIICSNGYTYSASWHFEHAHTRNHCKLDWFCRLPFPYDQLAFQACRFAESVLHQWTGN